MPGICWVSQAAGSMRWQHRGYVAVGGGCSEVILCALVGNELLPSCVTVPRGVKGDANGVGERWHSLKFIGTSA